jgi:hypothetical protein
LSEKKSQGLGLPNPGRPRNALMSVPYSWSDLGNLFHCN